MDQDITNRLYQWCGVIEERYKAIRAKYSQSGLRCPSEFDFKVEGPLKVVVKERSGFDAINVHQKDGGIVNFPACFSTRDIPAHLLSAIRNGILEKLSQFENEFDSKLAAKKALEAEYDASISRQMESFENDLTSDALQKGKIYPP